MLGCRREDDRNKGGLGGLACAGGDYLELCSACQVLSNMGYFRAFWGPAVGTTLVRGVFPHKLVDTAWASFKLVLKTQTQELLRKPSEGGEGLNAAYVKCAGLGGIRALVGSSTYLGNGADRGGQQDVVFEFPTITHCG